MLSCDHIAFTTSPNIRCTDYQLTLSVLWTVEFRFFLSTITIHVSTIWSSQFQPQSVELDYEQDDTFDVMSFGIREEVKGSSEEITAEQAQSLAVELDYDGSRLTPEQRRSIFMRTYAWHLKDNGLRSPQYYEDKSQCLSVSETAWPGAVAYVKADRLKRGYIEPVDLIERLRKWKPSDNFELRKYRHPEMSFEKSPIHGELAFNFCPHSPQWRADHHWELSQLIRSRISNGQRKIFEQAEREGRKRWAKIKSDVELDLATVPDLDLLRSMGQSPGGTLFPRYLEIMIRRSLAQMLARRSRFRRQRA